MCIFAVTAALIIFSSGRAIAEPNKNVILVLDTSMSMIGFGGNNIMDKVKSSIENYIDKLKDGDKVTFITFDTKVTIYPTILIDDKNDRDIAKKYISAIEAKGLWTYTIDMLKNVFKKAEEISKAEKDRKTVIVIMTDGIDDPPPGHRKDLFDIKSVSSEYSGKDWWIYFISFADLQKNEKLKGELEKELKKVSDKSQFIDAKDVPEKGIEDMQKSMKAQEGLQWRAILIIAAAVIILLIIIIRIAKKGGPKVKGRLEYWNIEILDPYIEKFDLTKKMSGEIVIGKKAQCHLYIRDITISGNFSIIALKNPVRLSIKGETGVDVMFKNKESSGILTDGDIFQAGNYGFKYIAG